VNKREFIKIIETGLKGFSNEEVTKIIEYYDEIINDYIDAGNSEEEAIRKLGDTNIIINDLKTNLIIERSTNKKSSSIKNFIIILSISTSPVLIPLGIAFFVIFLSLLIVLLSLFVSFSVSSIFLFAASVYTSLEMLILGIDAATILTIFGTLLFCGSVFGLLSIVIYKFSKTILHFINKRFSNILRKRNQKEVRDND